MLPPRIPGLSAADTELLHLGAVLGESDALGHVKGFCAAARALLFKRVKEEETYKRFKMTWEEFCPNVFHISRSEVDKQIALYGEFGPRYFDASEVAPISPETYRLLQDQFQDDALVFDGEAIPINSDLPRERQKTRQCDLGPAPPLQMPRHAAAAGDHLR